MSNARDDREWFEDTNREKRRQHSRSVFSPSEEIGEMHFSTENYSTALEYFGKALRFSEVRDYPDRFRLYLRISDCHRKKGSYEEALRFLENSRSLLPETAPSEALGKVEYREAYILLAQGDCDEALKVGFSAYRRLKHSSEHGEVADIQLLLANCYHRLGLLGEAEEFFTDALSSYRRIEDRVGVAYVYNNLGLLHKNACRWSRALASLSKSLEIAKSLGLTQHLIRVQLNLGVVYAKLRRFTDALSEFSSAATSAERFGDSDKLAKATLMAGRTFVQCGEFAKAEKNIVRAQAMANDLGYGRESALADEYLGELMLARGRLHEALVNFNNGLRKARKVAPEGDVVAEILRRLAESHFQLENFKKALMLVEEGLEVAENCGEFFELGFFYRVRGLSLSRLGEIDEAVESLKMSVEMFEKYGNPYEKACSEQFLARVYMKRKDEESLLKARQALSDSVVGFGKLEDAEGQILSQAILASVELKLGNLDDALLAVYEADRLADEEQDSKYRKLLQALRSRVESRMASATTRVLDQLSVFGDIQAGARSRKKLVSGVEAALKIILEKVGAQNGFVAIAGMDRKGLEVVHQEGMGKREARAVLAWYEKVSARDPERKGMIITNPKRYPELAEIAERLDVRMGTLVFQGLGFEGEDLGCLFLRRSGARSFSQEAMHFVASYASLISLSLFELVRSEKSRERRRFSSTKGFETIVTENQEMIKLLNLAERVAGSDATVLLEGETGTGKGLIAYAIHLLSSRRDRSFIHVNCAALPEPLLESELFGHVRGAFTGAIADKDGLLRQAHGGTVFLDEIGKTSLAMQGKLLQFLDTGKVRKVGSSELTPVDVRIICASKCDLLKRCHEGSFLEDFFYRINDFPLSVPPLRDRKEDIPLLVRHYLSRVSSKMGKAISVISEEALELLRAYRWPGNVRELEKVIQRAVILADDGEELGLEHLPPEIVLAKDNTHSRPRGTLKQKIAKVEHLEIVEALKRNSWNKSQTARDLGISYPNLLSKLKRYNILPY